MTDRRFINQHSLNQQGKLIDVECRFCRHKEKYNKWSYVAPCGCFGPVRYVHRECLQKWTVLKFQHVYNNDSSGDPEEFNVFCERCQQRIEIQFVLTHKLTKYDKFVEKLSSKKILLVVLLTLITLSIVGMIIFSILSHRQTKDIPTAVIVGLALSIAFFLVLFGVFIFKFLFIKSIYITFMANHREQPKIMGINERNIDSLAKQQIVNENAHFGKQQQRYQAKKIEDRSLMLQSKIGRDNNRNSRISEKQSVVSKTLTDYVMKRMYTHDETSAKGERNSKDMLNVDRRVSNNRIPSERQQEIMKKDQSIQVSNIPKSSKSIQYESKYNKNQSPSQQNRLNNNIRQNSQVNTILTSKTSKFKNGKEFSFQNKNLASKRKRIFTQKTITAARISNFQSSPTLNLTKPSLEQIQVLNNLPRQDQEYPNQDIYKQEDAEYQPQQAYCKDPIFIKDDQNADPKLNINSIPTSILNHPQSQQYTNQEDNQQGNQNDKLKLRNRNEPIKIKLLF